MRDGNDFRLAYVPETFTMELNEVFDLEYMKAPYEVGYDMAENGYPWATRPIGFDVVKLDVPDLE